MKPVILSFAALSLVATTATAQDMATAPKKKFAPFSQADADKDGFLSQAEWDASGRSPKRLAKVDTDKDGKVSQAELHAATVAAKAKDAQPKP